MGQHYLRQPTVMRLPALLAELYVGDLRIPPFQRDFVWTGEQRLHLLDSVYRGLPAGSVMTWRTTYSLATDPQIGPVLHDLSEAPQGAMRQYLLDGRQRLTTLFAALAPGLWTREDKPLPPDWRSDAPDGTPWAIFFDLEERDFSFEATGKECQRLPLSVLLDDFAFDEWLRQHGGDDRARWKTARTLKSAVVDYLIPVMPLHTDDLSAVTLTFKRVNRAGTPMGDLAMARALSWTHRGFDLEVKIDEILERLRPLGWGDLSGDTVLKILACVAGLEPMGVNVEELAAKLREDPKHLKALGETLTEVVKMFNAMGIAGPATLPYERALVMAAWTLRDLQRPLGEADRDRLMSWLAAACVSEAFRNTPPHVSRALHKELVAWIAKGRSSKRSWDVRRSRKFNMGWARSRVSAVALAQLGPLRGDGSLMFENASQALGERGNQIMCKLLAPGGRGFTAPQKWQAKKLDHRLRAMAANRVLCEPSQLPELRRSLLARDEAVCTSHAVPIDWTDLADLLDKRDELLLNAEKQWLDKQGGVADQGGRRLTWRQEPLLRNLKL